MTPKRYYTFMIDDELVEALKDLKERTETSEGAQIRQALRDWFAKQGVRVRKAERRRSDNRKRPSTRKRT